MFIRSSQKLLATAATAALLTSPAFAQDADEDEIIVTGVAQETKKVDATFSINTLNEDEIKRIGANGTAELLQNLPGFTGEGGTAGETHNNVLVRGLPQAGGFRYVPNLIDGLPAYEEPEAPFMNNDVFIKDDIMTTSVEAVKGGPGGILYSNALGTAVNYITRTGTDEFEGGYRLELGDWNHVRNDLYVSGPVNDNVTFAVGGFYRISDGIRDPGYTGNKGGQLRGNLKYVSDDGRTEVKVQGHVIRDKTIFYQNIPFALTSNRAPGTVDNPFPIRPDDVQSLGVDFSDGTGVSLATSSYDLFNPDGSSLELNIRDGINPEFDIFTANLSQEFGDGWEVSAGLRYTTGFNGFNAMFQDPPFETSSLTAQQFNRIQGINSDAGSDLFGAYDGATSVVAVFADSVNGTDLTSATSAPAFLAHDIPVYGRVDADNFTADVRLAKTFDIGSTTHDLTVGGYTSYYTYDVESVFASAFSDIGPDSRPVDLYAVDDNGQQVGPSISRGGVEQPAIFGLGADSEQVTRAFYLLDSISLMDDRLTIDAGIRYQELEVDRVTTNSFDPGNTSEDFTPLGTVVGSTSDTLADNFVNVPDGTPRFASESYDAFGYSIGANYRLMDESPLGEVNVYATYADSFRLPGFEDFIFGGPATNASTGEIARGDLVEDIKQYEGGFRTSNSSLDASVAFYYFDFQAKENLGPTLPDLTAPGCTAIPTPANCPVIRDSFRRGLESYGVELEAAWRPEFFEGFELAGSLTLQDPKSNQSNDIRSGLQASDTNNDNVNDTNSYLISTTDGRRPRRTSKVMYNIRPSYRFQELPLTIYGQAMSFSDRFASDDTSNVTIYEGYTQFNAGLLYEVSDALDFQLHVNNLNNADSFTEGSSINSGLQFSDGRYTGVARPLLGRNIKASLSYRF